MSISDKVADAYGENAYAVMAIITKELRKSQETELIETFTNEATSGDYEHLNEVCMDWAERIDNGSLEAP